MEVGLQFQFEIRRDSSRSLLQETRRGFPEMASATAFCGDFGLVISSSAFRLLAEVARYVIPPMHWNMSC